MGTTLMILPSAVDIAEILLPLFEAVVWICWMFQWTVPCLPWHSVLLSWFLPDHLGWILMHHLSLLVPCGKCMPLQVKQSLHGQLVRSNTLSVRFAFNDWRYSSTSIHPSFNEKSSKPEFLNFFPMSEK